MGLVTWPSPIPIRGDSALGSMKARGSSSSTGRMPEARPRGLSPARAMGVPVSFGQAEADKPRFRCPFGVTLPRKTAPSPCPDGSPPGVGTGLAKNSMVTV